MTRFNLDRIRSAPSRIAAEFLNTPQYVCEPLSVELQCHVTLKIETLNPIRCFKGRGTDLAVSRLVDVSGASSVVCASAGNLGQALAYSGRAQGMATTVVASATASPLKLQRIRALGATVTLVDGDIETARATAAKLATTTDAMLIEDSENLDTCEGAATIGLELATIANDLDAVLIALGGGAMATGVGYVLKQLAPHVDVVCVQPRQAPAMTLSWQARKVVETETCDTIADGVAGRCPIEVVLGDLLETADHALLVEEASIVKGTRLLYECAGLVVEPSAALGVAAILENPSVFKEKRVATIICGANVTPTDHRIWVGM